MALSTIQKIDRLSTDADLLHTITHGDKTTTVQTEGGAVPTIAKAIGDAQALMEVETDILHAVAQGDANTVVATANGDFDSMAKAIGSLKAFNVRGAWAAGMVLAMKDVVTYNGIAYVAVNAAAYVSNDVPTDLAAGRLTIHQGATREELAASSGAGLIGFLQSGAGSVARTAQDKLQDFYNLRDKGAVGDGVADDTNAIISACVSNRHVYCRAGATYRFKPSNLTRLTDLKNTTIDFQWATLLIDAPAPTGASQAYGFQLLSTVFGASANVRICNVRIQFVNAPGARVDNNFAIYADGVDGLEIHDVVIEGSWSAGIWVRRSNHVHIHDCNVSGTLADGITMQGCGYDIKIHDNQVQNAGDDMIAVTWFTADDPSYVGLLDGIKRSRDVHIYCNRLITGAQRGIFGGGMMGGSVHHNRVLYTNSIGIQLARNTVDPLGADGATANPFYSALGVNNSNTSVVIHHNWVWDCALNSNTPFPQLAGIWVSEGNEAINIHDNDIQRCNNTSIFCGGNARIHHNTSRDPQMQAGGSVTLAQMTYKGSHIVTANFVANSGSCSGSITDNEMYGGAGRAIWLQAGDNVRSWKVDGNKTYAVGNVTNISDTLTIGAPYVVDGINNTEWGFNTVTDYRSTSTIPGTLQLLNSGGTLARRPKKIVSVPTYPSDIIVGSGASVDPRTQLTATSTQLAMTVPANTRIFFDVAVAGAQLGAKSFVSPPGDVGGVLIDSKPLAAGGSVRNNLFNSTAAAVTIQAGTWLNSLGE
ncbi:right-handed parallel beta-helix repeat-containing protein [Paraburkholderia sp. RL17-381-BIF-C]|uniref:right-handed parallel beta-helix repeat-containing protein n=1 Tax=Paraburkholderia sp. RL17-381-BIF-C TaxID=3031635 RepID=UPI0038BC56EB